MAAQNRRTFLKSSLAAAGATFAISGTKSSGNILGSNDRVRIGVAGLNGRGKTHMGEFGKLKDVEITYLIDPDTRQFDRAVKSVGGEPKTVQDVRRALDDPNLDAISIATPNHWHALMTIWACQAGKDVYVEKPMSHNVHEGRLAVDAARKHNCIVQHGTQSRSSRKWQKIAALIKSGKYGKLKTSYAYCYKRRPSIGVKPITSPPDGLDFNIWTGPAQEMEFHTNLVHYNWHWFWETGNGDLGNQGVHQMDIARWGIPGATLPNTVFSVGGRLGYEDQGETANTQLVVMDFDGTQLIFEVRGLRTPRKVDNEFVLEEGKIADGKFFPNGSDKGVALADVEFESGPAGDNNFANFIAAVKSRNTDDLNADILEGHFSSALCHLGNISYRLGKPVSFSNQTKIESLFDGNAAAAESFANMQDHLSRENHIKLAETQLQVGQALTIDTEAENFVDAPAANEMLTRNYRAPFAPNVESRAAAKAG